MSIWSSVGPVGESGDVRAIDLHAPDSDEHKGIGVPRVDVDVATATSWHSLIRLSADADEGVHFCLALDVPTALRLAALLSEACNEVVIRSGAGTHEGSVVTTLGEELERAVLDLWSGQGLLSTANHHRPAASVSFEDIVAMCHKLVPVRPQRVLAELRVGGRAHEALLRCVDKTPPDPADRVSRLVGVRVVPDETLAADEWEMRDQHGEVIDRGAVGGSWFRPDPGAAGVLSPFVRL